MDIKLDSDGDIEIAKNDVSLIDGAESIRQHLDIRLNTHLGEWLFDTRVGVPWIRDILVKRPDYKIIEDILKTKIIETPGVTGILEFFFETQDRVVTLNFTANTDDGLISDFTTFVDL